MPVLGFGTLIADATATLSATPHGGCTGARTPPDTIAQSFRIGFKTQHPRWIGEHWMWIWLSKAPATQQLEKLFGVAPPHRGIETDLLHTESVYVPLNFLPELKHLHDADYNISYVRSKKASSKR